MEVNKKTRSLQYNESIEKAQELQTVSSLTYGAAAFSEFANAKINYDLLKTSAHQAETQAQSIELQAQQRANMLREQFNNDVGNAVAGAAMRGVDVNSGSIAQNIEMSAGNLGSDISILKSNARSKASALRTQAKINKRIGKAQLISGIGSGAMAGLKSYDLFNMEVKK